MTELGRRVLSSLVLIPVALAAGYYGDWALAALLAIAAALAAHEYFRIARAGGVEGLSAVGVVAAAVIPLAVHAHYRGVFRVSFTWLAVLAVVTFGLAIFLRGPSRRPLSATAVTVFGILYTGGALSYGYALRYHPYVVAPDGPGRAAGAALLLFPLLLTWTTDTGAYVVGRAVGRRKLIPAVSPGKSVEGAVGGLLLAMLVAWTYQRYVLMPAARLSLWPGAVLMFGAVVSVAAQLGDLAESLIKREAGVKDSSRIIPGHGGVLDRLDSLLFVLPVAYWLLTILKLLPVPR